MISSDADIRARGRGKGQCVRRMADRIPARIMRISKISARDPHDVVGRNHSIYVLYVVCGSVAICTVLCSSC